MSKKTNRHIGLNTAIESIRESLLKRDYLNADAQLIRLLFDPALASRWGHGTAFAPRILTHISTVVFDEAIDTAAVDSIKTKKMWLNPKFFIKNIAGVEDLLAIAFHERNHILIRRLVYPKIAYEQYAPDRAPGNTLPHNLLDDVLDNAIVRQNVFSDVFERFYISTGQTTHAGDEAAADNGTETVNVQRWWLPLLTFRSDLLGASLQKLMDYFNTALPTYGDRKNASQVLNALLALHVALYEQPRKKLYDAIKVAKEAGVDTTTLRTLYKQMEESANPNPVGDSITKKQFVKQCYALAENSVYSNTLTALRALFFQIRELLRQAKANQEPPKEEEQNSPEESESESEDSDESSESASGSESSESSEEEEEKPSDEEKEEEEDDAESGSASDEESGEEESDDASAEGDGSGEDGSEESDEHNGKPPRRQPVADEDASAEEEGEPASGEGESTSEEEDGEGGEGSGDTSTDDEGSQEPGNAQSPGDNGSFYDDYEPNGPQLLGEQEAEQQDPFPKNEDPLADPVKRTSTRWDRDTSATIDIECDGGYVEQSEVYVSRSVIDTPIEYAEVLKQALAEALDDPAWTTQPSLVDPRMRIQLQMSAQMKKYSDILVELAGDLISATPPEIPHYRMQFDMPVHLSKSAIFTMALGGAPPPYYITEFSKTEDKYKLFMDVSGSQNKFLPLLPDFVRSIRHICDAFFQFSDVIIDFDMDGDYREVLSTGGTSFTQVGLNIIRNQYKKVIVWTDNAGSIATPVFQSLLEQGAANDLDLILILTEESCIRYPYSWPGLNPRKIVKLY